MKTFKKGLISMLVCTFAALSLGAFAACTEDGTEPQPKQLDHIELNTENVTTAFTVGDAFTYEGLEVRAFYDDETSAIVAGYTVTANGLAEDKLTAESNEATVTYTEEGVTKTATYAITVTEAGTPDDDSDDPDIPEDPTVITSIAVSKLPDQTEYYVGEAFSAEGLAIEIFYANGNSDITTMGISASASTLLAGEITVPVTFEGMSTSFTITVYNKLTGLTVEGASMQRVGDAFGGVKVTALYNGKTTGGTVLGEDDYELTITPALNEGKFDAAGKYTVAVSYSEEKIAGRPLNASETFAISVIDAVAGDTAEEYNLTYSTEADYVQNADLLGRWVYYHTAEENGEALGSKANGTYKSGILTFNFTDNAGDWWRTQLFYKNPEFATGSRHSVTMTLLSDFDGSVTVNGHVYALVSGEAQEVEFTFTQGANATLSVQLGVESGNVPAAESGKLTVYGVAFGEAGEPDPGTGDADSVVYDVYNVFFDPNIISVWFRTANCTQEDMQSAELLVNGEFFAHPSQILTNDVEGQYKLLFDNVFSLSGSAEGTRYAIAFQFDGATYSPVNGLAGGPWTDGGNTYTLAAEGDGLVLTVKSVGTTQPDPGTGEGGETEPGDVRTITVTNVDFYAPGFVKIYMSEGDLAYLAANAAYVETNGQKYAHGSGKGFLVDGTLCIQVQFTDGDTSFSCEWYDAAGNLIAICTFAKA